MRLFLPALLAGTGPTSSESKAAARLRKLHFFQSNLQEFQFGTCTTCTLQCDLCTVCIGWRACRLRSDLRDQGETRMIMKGRKTDDHDFHTQSGWRHAHQHSPARAGRGAAFPEPTVG